MTDDELQQLPKELRDQLKSDRNAGMEQRLIKLFDDGKQRTLNDVLVDYWHAHEEVLKRGTVASALASMAKRGNAIRRAGKGVYVTIKPMPPLQPAEPRYPTPEHMWGGEPNKVTGSGEANETQ